MTPVELASRQLVDELNLRLDRLTRLLGVDGDEIVGLATEQVPSITTLLLDPNAAIGAGVGRDTLAALWPAPEAGPPPGWWATPLGRALARHAVDRDDDSAVTRAVAAVMLGISEGAVATYTSRGTLKQNEKGGIYRREVLRRIGELHARQLELDARRAPEAGQEALRDAV